MMIADFASTLSSNAAEYVGEIMASLLTCVAALLRHHIIALYKRTRKAVSLSRRRPSVLANQRAATGTRDALLRLQEKHGAARALLFMFHNGDSFTSGNSILKMSCTAEVTDPGLSSMADSCKYVLLSTVPEAVQFIYDSRAATTKPDTDWHPIVRENLPGGSLRATFTNFRVAVSMHRIIYDMSNPKSPEPIGFIALQFTEIDDVRCTSECIGRPCVTFTGQDAIVASALSRCEAWNTSSLDLISVIEKNLNDPALQSSWFRRLFGSFKSNS